jgi:GNAT superfamily N-acetyltransferase
MIREASSADDAVMDAIAREGEASADAKYLGLVRSQGGRLLVAETAGRRVVAYGGVVEIDGVAMLTDLFVSADARGSGIGTELLGELFGNTRRRMTFSSKHPAALAAYHRAGMEPRWRLLYLEGRAIGGGELPPETWRHDRGSLVDVMAGQGAHVSADAVSMPGKGGIWIMRLQSAEPVDAVTTALRAIPAGTVVTMCTPERSPVATWAKANGFSITDSDTFCATPGVDIAADLHCLDPGLA